MRIDSLKVENFRCFEKEEWEFAPGFNVFIGDNGAGKTAIIKALRIAVGAFFLGIDNQQSPGIESFDLRYEIGLRGDEWTKRTKLPAVIKAGGIVDEQAITWERSRAGIQNKTAYGKASKLFSIARKIQHLLNEGKDTLVPIIAYYGAGRLFQIKQDRSSRPVKPKSPTYAYRTSLDAESDFDYQMGWWEQRIISAGRNILGTPSLTGLYNAILSCLGEDWKEIVFASYDEIAAMNPRGELHPLRSLSDGQRCMIATALDIAYRCIVLNSHLMSRAPQETPGVVLIDELDLHLHPNWQRTIVPNLRRAFPKVQFFVTTHSPIILQGLDPKLDRVIRLNAPSPSTYPPVEDFVDRPLEDILIDVQDYPAFKLSERRQAMIAAAEKYYTVLKQAEKASDEELERLKHEMDELALPFHEDYAYIAFLNMERQAALGERN